MTQPKIAIVADWLTNMGGAEEVILAMSEAFPEAPIYTSVFEPDAMPRFKGLDIRTSWIQKLPGFLRKRHRWFAVLHVRAFRSLDLSEFDVILLSDLISSKHIQKSRPDQVVVSYCHTPVRYYWSHEKEYRQDPGFGKLNWLVKLLIPLFMPRQKKLDLAAAQKIDTYIANSTVVQKRIKKYYGKPSTVIHPPVDTKRFRPARERADYYVALSRQVPYKRVDLAVAAATKLDLPLKVFGSGPQHEQLVAMAGPTVEFFTDRFGDASDQAVEEALSHAKGFIFSAEEDFGIVQVEALAAGAPLITFAKGGSRDIVTSPEIGIMFAEQTVDSVVEAIQEAEASQFFPSKLQRVARRYDKQFFISKLQKVVADSYPSKSL